MKPISQIVRLALCLSFTFGSGQSLLASEVTTKNTPDEILSSDEMLTLEQEISQYISDYYQTYDYYSLDTEALGQLIQRDLEVGGLEFKKIAQTLGQERGMYLSLATDWQRQLQEDIRQRPMAERAEAWARSYLQNFTATKVDAIVAYLVLRMHMVDEGYAMRPLWMLLQGFKNAGLGEGQRLTNLENSNFWQNSSEALMVTLVSAFAIGSVRSLSTGRLRAFLESKFSHLYDRSRGIRGRLTHRPKLLPAPGAITRGEDLNIRRQLEGILIQAEKTPKSTNNQQLIPYYLDNGKWVKSQAEFVKPYGPIEPIKIIGEKHSLKILGAETKETAESVLDNLKLGRILRFFDLSEKERRQAILKFMGVHLGASAVLGGAETLARHHQLPPFADPHLLPDELMSDFFNDTLVLQLQCRARELIHNIQSHNYLSDTGAEDYKQDAIRLNTLTSEYAILRNMYNFGLNAHSLPAYQVFSDGRAWISKESDGKVYMVREFNNLSVQESWACPGIEPDTEGNFQVSLAEGLVDLNFALTTMQAKRVIEEFKKIQPSLASKLENSPTSLDALLADDGEWEVAHGKIPDFLQKVFSRWSERVLELSPYHIVEFIQSQIAAARSGDALAVATLVSLQLKMDEKKVDNVKIEPIYLLGGGR